MAEGWLRHLAGDRFESLSAGVSPAGFVHRIASTVMREVGIEIASFRSKSIREFLPAEGTPPDMIISVCDSANEKCPVFPDTVERLLWPVDDPYYSECEGEDLVNEYRRVRDEIRAAIEAGITNGAIGVAK
jgi:arsenate reductase